MHARKRIEIVVEAVRAEAVTALLDRLGAPGWTMLPVLSGRGHQGLRQAGIPGGVMDNVLILCRGAAGGAPGHPQHLRHRSAAPRAFLTRRG